MLRTALSLARTAAPRTRLAPLVAAPPPSAPHRRTFSRSPVPQAEQLTDGEKTLKDRLEQGLDGAKVQVQDVSGGCGSFYAISVEHESFKGLSMIKQHRIVNDLLKDDIKGMHGLQLKTKAP
ncbi:hypothetical protein Rhopal_003523-T1 [Rhodotorula paludigena]|uniref:Bola-like protein n=1 Tax=Rhodotorula paludigena TaxID=86838 RepID=A0AAV5GM19_9BASI|nr:hypothetical protein Rhopal_003523-T1 [Rhodotorula paludigena]